MDRKADTILTNGRIYTVDRAQPWAEAVAISGGCILAAGSAADIMAAKGPDTEVIDLGGRMAMPGFADVHNHIMMGGEAALSRLVGARQGSFQRAGVARC